MTLDQFSLATLWPLVIKAGFALGGALLVMAAFWIVAWILGKVTRRLANTQPYRRDVINLLGTVVRWSVLGFGIVTALGTLGLDVTGLITGLGLAGFAVGFALKDIISSLLAGILIMLNRPFITGDRIRVTGIEGIVTGIQLRYTAVLDDDGNRHLVPNATVLAQIVTLPVEKPPEAAPPAVPDIPPNSG